MDIARYNRAAWNEQVARGNRWTIPVSRDVIAAARQGRWEVVLTPQHPVPDAWIPPIHELEILCCWALWNNRMTQQFIEAWKRTDPRSLFKLSLLNTSVVSHVRSKWK